MFRAVLIMSCGLGLGVAGGPLSAAEPLRPGVRGIATRAPDRMLIDGDLSEFREAFVTPVEYFHTDPQLLKNRAAQFFYMWDDTAFYAGLRTLDQKPANNADDDHLWEGDGVEWYFDTRRGDAFRSTTWTPGAVHCYWTGLKQTEVVPRFCLRPGYLDAIPKIGVEVAARRTDVGLDVEFKLPWANFPDFKPAINEVVALDAELCYSNGGPRVERTFAYGSPLSVQQPASLARVQLVERFEADYWKACGPVMLPLRIDTEWSQPTRHQVTGIVAIPPNVAERVGKIAIRLTNLEGEPLGEFETRREIFEPQGTFVRAVAQWPGDVAPPGGYHATALVYDTEGRELTRVAPRLVSVKMQVGY